MSVPEPVASDQPGPAAPSLGAQALWLLTARGIAFAFSIAQPLVLVRTLSQADFGLYKQVFLVIGTASTVLPLGFGMSAFYFLPRERQRQSAIITNIIVFHFAIGMALAVVLALAPGLLAWVFNSPEFTPQAQLIAIVVLLWTVGTFLEIAPVALQDVRASTAIIIANQFSKTVLLLGAAVLFASVRALIVGALVHGLVQVALMVAYLHWRFPGFWRSFDLRLLSKQATYQLPVGASGLLWRTQDDVHQAFVSNAFGPAAYAIYAVGMFKLPLIGMLRDSVGSVVLPRINELETRNEHHRLVGLVAAAARKLALVYLPTYAGLMVMGRELIRALFTERYVDSWPIFAISMTTLPLGIIVLDPVTRAHSERYFFLWLRIALFAALALVLWRFTEALGMIGVITVVMIVSALGWLVSVVRMARLLKATRRDLALFADVARIAVAAGLAAGVALVVRQLIGTESPWLVLLVCGPVLGLVYVLAILQARVVGREEVTRLVREVVRSVFPERRSRPAETPGQAPARDAARSIP